MTLDRTLKGSTLKVLSISDRFVRTQVIRFGISEGERIVCTEMIPGGPVIIRKNRQEIALGRELARGIEVIPANGEDG